MSQLSRLNSVVAWISLVGVVVLGGVLVMTGGKEKKAFVVNQKLFEGFKGTKELENKLTALKKAHAASLDSLGQLLKDHASAPAIQQYQELSRQQVAKEQQVSERYTAELWATINKHVSEYGKEKGYDFIFGAAGNGSLMYAKESVNITEEVVVYMNGKY